MLNNDIALVVKDKISLLQIVGQRIKVSKRGGRYLALCPFHKEKTPSFSVDESKGLFHCFGCGKGGDVYDFLKDYDNLSFKEAIEYLANIAGVSLSNYNTKENYSSNKETSKSHYQLLELATKWFQEQLISKENSIALEYFLKRRISKYTLDKFQLGYAPKNKDYLSDFLQKQGFTSTDMIDLGIRGEGSNGNYDVFRDRVIFPIKNKVGKVIAFGGRSLNNEMPKYLNSKDTVLFHKKHNLYGLSEANKVLRDKNAIILVEGYMDALALHQAGFAAVAPLGTAISKEQLQLLIKLKLPILVCLDGDEAGKNASLKTASLFLEVIEAGILPKFMTMPKGEDPDSFLEKFSKDEFITLMEEAKYLSDFLWQETIKDVADTTPEVKALLQKELMSYCKNINSSSLRDEFSKYFSSKLNEKFANTIYISDQASVNSKYRKNYNIFHNKYLDKNKVAKIALASNTALMTNVNKNNLLTREYFLLAYVISCPEIYSNIEQEFALLSFSDKKLEELKQVLVGLLEQNNDLNTENIKQELAKNGFTTILHSILNTLVIKKALARLQGYQEFINAFYDTYNRLLFDSLSNDMVTVKRNLLEETIHKDEKTGTKITDQIKHLQHEIKQTKFFKGKI